MVHLRERASPAQDGAKRAGPHRPARMTPSGRPAGGTRESEARRSARPTRPGQPEAASSPEEEANRHSDPRGSGDRIGPPASRGPGGGDRPARRAAPAADSRRTAPASSKGAAQMGRQVYELRVRGPVSAELLEEIGAEDLGEEPPLTILRTEPTDQPGLHGMLQRLRSLGLDLMEVRTTGPEPYVDDST